MARRTVTRRGRSGAAAPRRKFIWARDAGTIIVAAADEANRDLLGNFETAYGADLLGCTITRIRGVILANWAAAVDTATSAWAIRVATGDLAPEIGPSLQPNADWMAYEPLVVATGGAAGTDGVVQTYRSIVDIKSMRKLDELDQTLMLSVSNTVAATALDFSFHLSIGVKLP